MLRTFVAEHQMWLRSSSLKLQNPQVLTGRDRSSGLEGQQRQVVVVVIRGGKWRQQRHGVGVGLVQTGKATARDVVAQEAVPAGLSVGSF